MLVAEHVPMVDGRFWGAQEARMEIRKPRPSLTVDPEVGDHLCCFYQFEEEHAAALRPLLRQGLERGEQVLYIAGERAQRSALDRLREDGLDPEVCRARGQLAFLSEEETYLQGGTFDPERMLALLSGRVEQALAAAYSALRLAGEMDWATRGLLGSERLVEYESAVNRALAGSRGLGLCLYDRRRFGPAVPLEVLDTHPLVLVAAHLYENPCCFPPAYLSRPEMAGERLRRRLRDLVPHRPEREEPALAAQGWQAAFDALHDACFTIGGRE